MSGRTWVMMLLMLALNWGGFIAMIVCTMRRERRKAEERVESHGRG